MRQVRTVLATLAVVPSVLLLTGCISSETKGINGSLNDSAKSDLRSAVTTVELCRVEGGALPQSSYGGPGQPVGLQCGGGAETITVSPGNSLSYSNLGTSYSIAVTTSANQTFTYDSTTASIQGP